MSLRLTAATTRILRHGRTRVPSRALFGTPTTLRNAQKSAAEAFKPVFSAHAGTGLPSPLIPVYAETLFLGPRPRTTHETSSLSPALLNNRTTIAGWLVSKRKANASLWFFTLRDSFGTVQLVINAKDIPGVESEAERLMNVPLESVVQVHGTVKERVKKGNADTGARMVCPFSSLRLILPLIVSWKPVDEVEIHVDSALVLNPADKTLPFYPNHPELVCPAPFCPSPGRIA